MVLAVKEILVKGRPLIKVTHIKHLEDWAHADNKDQSNEAQLLLIFTLISGQAQAI